MDNLLLTLRTVLPVFLVMIAGFLCRLLRVTDDQTVKAMNRMVFNVFLPVSLAKSLMGVGSIGAGELRCMGYCCLGILCTFALATWLIPKAEPVNARRGVVIQAIFRSNYAIFGLPLAEALFPEGDGGVAAMMVVASVPVFNVLAVVTLETWRGGKCDLRKAIIGVARNPLIWGCVIGYLIHLFPFDLPQSVMSGVSKVGGIASPLALFALGASFDPKKLKGNGRALVIAAAGKLAIVPVVLLTGAYLLGFRGPQFAALMIAFGAPCAVSSYTMAAQMGGDADLAGQAVMLTTALSAVTVFLLIFVSKSLGIF